MLFNHGMRNGANDNQDTWQPLSLATERLLPKLEKQKESTRQKQDGEHDPDQEPMERRVRDILEMENRLRRKMN
jgi:uncharacterized membrane-anchored protein YhcB (DUF1043 family)